MLYAWTQARDFYESEAAEFQSLVKQHRNHPSVVVWGLCNELECWHNQNDNPSGPNATIIAFKIVIGDLDDGIHHRPAAFNDNGEINDLEIAGFSHESVHAFEAYHNGSASTPLLSSECCSCESDRTSLPSVDCMRGQNAPGLLPFVAGSVGVWTLNDYYGEQGKWPTTVASYGKLSLILALYAGVYMHISSLIRSTACLIVLCATACHWNLRACSLLPTK